MSTHYPAGPWARAVIFTQSPEKEWQNDMWFTAGGTASSAFDIQAAAAAFDTAFNAPYVAALCEVSTYQGVNFYYNDGAMTRRGETFPASGGTVTGNQLPSEDAAVVTLNSGIGTRKGVGRVFIGGVAESAVDLSRLKPGSITQYNALFAALKTGWTYAGVTFKLAVWSRLAGSVNAVSYYQAEQVLGHIRHRRPVR